MESQYLFGRFGPVYSLTKVDIHQDQIDIGSPGDQLYRPLAAVSSYDLIPVLCK